MLQVYNRTKGINKIKDTGQNKTNHFPILEANE